MPIKTPVARAVVNRRRPQQQLREQKRNSSSIVAILALSLLFGCVTLFFYVAGSKLFYGTSVSPSTVVNFVQNSAAGWWPSPSKKETGKGKEPNENMPVGERTIHQVDVGKVENEIETKSKDNIETNRADLQQNPPKRDRRGRNDPDLTLLKNIDFGNEPHIALIHGEKDGTIKQDMRVVIPDFEIERIQEHDHGQSSNIVGAPHAYLEAQKTLQALPLLHYLNEEAKQSSPSLEDAMIYIHNLPQCSNKPVFLSMASVGDDLYWQLIENFVYTMVKFNTVECALVICVSDANCMKLCDAAHFPCYNFHSAVVPLPSVMEQIGEVKLFHVPKALEKGVDVFMLDLDVGFLNDPMVMVRAFDATPKVDIFVQEDLIFIMNRTKAGWRTWFTQPLPNIGLFLCRGNEKTARVFSMAWKKYQNMEDKLSKMNPGKDQNHVLDAMRYGRANFGLRYAYFSNSSAVLLDKLVLSVDRSVELGGAASDNLLASEHTIAAHTTCYEHTTKVLGLKATNAFWNPLYYDPLRPTLTKQIMYISDYQVLDEVRTLLWLGMATGRAVIIPNLLGNPDIHGAHSHQGQVMWPGFRVAKIKRERGVAALKVDILEPAFYWRVQRDYDRAPDPAVLTFTTEDSAETIMNRIKDQGSAAPRIVLNVAKGRRSVEAAEKRMVAWAQHSVGVFEKSYNEEHHRYSQLPSVKGLDRNLPFVNTVLGGLRNCDDIFSPHKGNRSCFQICE